MTSHRVLSHPKSHMVSLIYGTRNCYKLLGMCETNELSLHPTLRSLVWEETLDLLCNVNDINLIHDAFGSQLEKGICKTAFSMLITHG